MVLNTIRNRFCGRNRFTLYIIVTPSIFWRSIIQKQTKINQGFYCKHCSTKRYLSRDTKYITFCERDKFTLHTMVAWCIIWSSITLNRTKISHNFYSKYLSAKTSLSIETKLNRFWAQRCLPMTSCSRDQQVPAKNILVDFQI